MYETIFTVGSLLTYWNFEITNLDMNLTINVESCHLLQNNILVIGEISYIYIYFLFLKRSLIRKEVIPQDRLISYVHTYMYSMFGLFVSALLIFQLLKKRINVPYESCLNWWRKVNRILGLACYCVQIFEYQCNFFK